MAFAIDGTVHANVSTQNNVVNLTTSLANDYVIVVVAANGGPVLSVSSTALGSFTFIGRGGSSPFTEEIWAAFSSGTLSSDPITVHQTSAAFCTVDAFGVSGSGQTSLVFDSGGPQTGSSDPISITTANANTIVIAGFRSNAPDPSAGSGFTQVSGSGADFSVVEYKVLSTTQTLSCTLTNGAGGSNGSIVIAIPQASGASLITGWQNESSDIYCASPLKLSERPAFVSTFKTAPISGSAWNAQRDHAKLPPSVVFSDAPAYGHPAFVPPSTIAGMAWYEPPDRDVPARKINIEALPAAFVSTFKTAPILGMAWFIPPDSYGVVEKISGSDGPPMGRAPTPNSFGWFVSVDVPGIERPQIQQYDPSDVQRPLNSAVGISGMAWYKQPDIPGIVEKVFDSGIAGPTNAITQVAFGWFVPPDRARPATKANVESLPAYVRPPKVFTPISGIGWFEPPDRDAPATKFKIEAPPSIALTPATLPVKISGMAWFAPRDRDWHSASVTFDHPPAFTRFPFTTITGTLAATEGYDIASFVISFSRWTPKNIQSETWTNKTKQDETWIVRTIQPETWTPE